MGHVTGPETRDKIRAALVGCTGVLGARNGSWNFEGWRISGHRYKVRIVTGWEWHARAVWTQAHGVIPRGWRVHHDDEDTFNDSDENLRAMTQSDHVRLHSASL